MTAPPLPASPCLRVKLDYTDGGGNELGSRFYLSYAGAAPTGGNCATLASDIATAWNSHLAPNIQEGYSLVQVDVLDIASLTGLSGQWEGSDAGGNTGAYLPGNVAVNVEYNIARRYRGGKPRMFLPPPGAGEQVDPNHWTADFIAAVSSGVTAFFAEIEAVSVGAVGALAHVNLSYYYGFTNHANSSGREHAIPTYRDAALLDTVSGYAPKAVVGSQRRRRTSTTY